jgi:hypothetical protein
MTISLRNPESIRGRRVDSSERSKKKAPPVKAPSSGYTPQELRAILFLSDHDVELDDAAEEVVSWRS